MRKDGNTFPVIAYASPVMRQGKPFGLRGIVVDITERMQSEENAARAQALEEINRLKTNLLARVSHELRTPLTSIKGLASTLIQPDVEWDSETQWDFLTSIVQESDRLDHIVGDLVDMSRLGAGTMKMTKIPSTVSSIVVQLSDELQGLTPKHHLEIDVSDDLPTIHVDKVRIGQIITNLIENAAAYSEEGSEINLSATHVDGYVLVTVVDQGVGIPADHRDKVFEEFYRLRSGESLRSGGSGFGLSICKGIAEAHGGAIWVESEIGEGSKFTIGLPVAEDAVMCNEGVLCDGTKNADQIQKKGNH